MTSATAVAPATESPLQRRSLAELSMAASHAAYSGSEDITLSPHVHVSHTHLLVHVSHTHTTHTTCTALTFSYANEAIFIIPGGGGGLALTLHVLLAFSILTPH